VSIARAQRAYDAQMPDDGPSGPMDDTIETLRAIARSIRRYDRYTAQEEYSDPDDVWDLFANLRRRAIVAARAARQAAAKAEGYDFDLRR